MATTTTTGRLVSLIILWFLFLFGVLVLIQVILISSLFVSLGNRKENENCRETEAIFLLVYYIYICILLYPSFSLSLTIWKIVLSINAPIHFLFSLFKNRLSDAGISTEQKIGDNNLNQVRNSPILLLHFPESCFYTNKLILFVYPNTFLVCR